MELTGYPTCEVGGVEPAHGGRASAGMRTEQCETDTRVPGQEGKPRIDTPREKYHILLIGLGLWSGHFVVLLHIRVVTQWRHAGRVLTSVGMSYSTLTTGISQLDVDNNSFSSHHLDIPTSTSLHHSIITSPAPPWPPTSISPMSSGIPFSSSLMRSVSPHGSLRLSASAPRKPSTASHLLSRAHLAYPVSQCGRHTGRSLPMVCHLDPAVSRVAALYHSQC